MLFQIQYEYGDKEEHYKPYQYDENWNITSSKVLKSHGVNINDDLVIKNETLNYKFNIKLAPSNYFDYKLLNTQFNFGYACIATKKEYPIELKLKSGKVGVDYKATFHENILLFIETIYDESFKAVSKINNNISYPDLHISNNANFTHGSIVASSKLGFFYKNMFYNCIVQTTNVYEYIHDLAKQINVNTSKLKLALKLSLTETLTDEPDEDIKFTETRKYETTPIKYDITASDILEMNVFDCSIAYMDSILIHEGFKTLIPDIEDLSVKQFNTLDTLK